MAAPNYDFSKHIGLTVYDALSSEGLSEKEKAKIIAEAISSLEDRFPNLQHVSTKSDVKETELKLQKEIENTRLEIKNVEARLQKEIESIRLEISDNRLEIKNLEIRLESKISETNERIADTKSSLLKWSFLFWATQLAATIAILYKIA